MHQTTSLSVNLSRTLQILFNSIHVLPPAHKCATDVYIYIVYSLSDRGIANPFVWEKLHNTHKHNDRPRSSN